MEGLDKLIEELKKQHGQELDLNNDHYFLFYKDAVFQIYIDQDEMELKVDVTFIGESRKVYFSDKSISDDLPMFLAKED